MNVLIAAKDAVFARMLSLEFEEKGIRPLLASTSEEIEDALKRAHFAVIDASFLMTQKLPAFAFDIVIFGYPDELAKIETQELTKYYALARPFSVEDFFSSLFSSDDPLSKREIHLPKKKKPVESLALDKAGRIAFYKGEKITLTQKEFALLSLLFENRGTPVSREKAFTEIFGDTENKTNVVDVYINYLRTKIDNRFNIRLITTVRGCGYMILV